MSDKDPLTKINIPGNSRRLSQKLHKPHLSYFIWAYIVLYALRNLLPSFILTGFLSTFSVLFLIQLFLFKRWQDELQYLPLFAKCFLAMLAELFVENILVWIVSATDQNKYDYTPLQDNLRLIINYLSSHTSIIDFFATFKAADTLQFLLACISLALASAWDQTPYSGFGMMSRFCLTVALSRSIRVVSFLITVLPSPRHGCYKSRFPPAPETFWGMLRVGVYELRGFGGCNDLIFSGHAALWVITPLIYSTFYKSQNLLARWIVPAYWVLLIMTSIQDIVTLQHYSVDMFLAVVITWFVWDKLEGVYTPQEVVSMIQTDAPMPKIVLLPIFAGVGFAAVMVFIGKA